MDGAMKVTYTILCSSDVNKEISLEDVLGNEKIVKAIKGEFAKGIRNIVLAAKENTKITIKTEKKQYEFQVSKNDFADLLELAEEDARKHKRFKKGCDGIELVDIVTID
jgi:phosphosulfolactate phosphohydrolase-like enzyme